MGRSGRSLHEEGGHLSLMKMGRMSTDSMVVRPADRTAASSLWPSSKPRTGSRPSALSRRPRSGPTPAKPSEDARSPERSGETMAGAASSRTRKSGNARYRMQPCGRSSTTCCSPTLIFGSTGAEATTAWPATKWPTRSRALPHSAPYLHERSGSPAPVILCRDEDARPATHAWSRAGSAESAAHAGRPEVALLANEVP